MTLADDERFQQLMREEMAECSPAFLRGVAYLSVGNFESAMPQFQESWMNAEDTGTREGDALHVSREWIDAFCGSMFCAMSSGYYEDVAELDRKFAVWLMAQSPTSRNGVRLMIDGGGVPSRAGWCWYFDATVTSYDRLDRFDEAVTQSDMAIAYFSKNSHSGNLSYHQSKRASLLQQRASVRSRDPQTQEEARTDIVEAIHSMYDSLAISVEGWEEDCARPLSTMKQVATRLGVSGSDLTFVDWSSDAGGVIRRFFDPGEKRVASSPFEQSSAFFNQAIDAKQAGQLGLAEKLFEAAFSCVPEDTEENRMLKGFVSYQLGVFLLHSNDLEGKRGRLSDKEFAVVARVRDCWEKTRQLVGGISVTKMESFGLPILDALQAIKEDQWIRIAGLTKWDPVTGEPEMRSLSGTVPQPEKKTGLLGRLFGRGR